MKKSGFMPIEKYYALKSTFESIWGKGTYLKLKYCSNLMVWKRYAKRTLLASEMTILETIAVMDEDWKSSAREVVRHGIERLSSAKDLVVGQFEIQPC